MLLPILLLVLVIPFTETCVKVTSTDIPGTCYTCNGDQLVPSPLQEGIVFEYNMDSSPGQCVQGTAVCLRNGTRIQCSAVMRSNGKIITQGYKYELKASFTCSANGKFVFDGTEIGRLECEFTDCG